MTQTMRRKLKRAGYRSRYRLRKQIVEPVFGQIKQARGFRQFLLRGLEAVQADWPHRPQHHKARQGDLSAPISNPHSFQTLSGRAPSISQEVLPALEVSVTEVPALGVLVTEVPALLVAPRCRMCLKL